MKIVLVITKSNWGGAQKYVYDVATELTKRGFTAVVAAGGNGELIKRLDHAGIHTVSIPDAVRDISVFKDIRSFFWLLQFIKKERPDVLHLNSSKIGGLGALVGRLLGVRHIVFTGHGWSFNEDRPWIQKKILHLLHLLTVALSHTTICVSETTKRQLRTPLFLETKCIVIHNGISQIAFKTPNAFYEDFKTTRKERTAIVSIGELHPSKGFDLALSHLQHLQDLSWEWFILGEGHARASLEALIAKYDLSSRVHLVGHVHDAASYLESFDLFLLPSRTEALAYVAIEALQTDLPIIASNVGGIPEVLGKDPGTRLVDIRQKTVENTLRETLSSYPQKITTGREDLRKEFSLEHMINTTIEVYRN